jgi:hypothetical protein
LELTDVKQLSAEELTIARQEALELENRAYDISEVYREADPAGISDVNGNGILNDLFIA